VSHQLTFASLARTFPGCWKKWKPGILQPSPKSGTGDIPAANVFWNAEHSGGTELIESWGYTTLRSTWAYWNVIWLTRAPLQGG
jgi:hypothetical protein